jgi:hypothetical protein
VAAKGLAEASIPHRFQSRARDANADVAGANSAWNVLGISALAVYSPKRVEVVLPEALIAWVQHQRATLSEMGVEAVL